MKKMCLMFTLFLFSIMLFGYNVDNYREQGGARWVIGGDLDVVSGGEIDIETGATLEIAGTAITSTAAELNILDGVTSTAAELNILDGVTSTAAELNTVDGATAGTAVASKAVVLDASKDISGLNAVGIATLTVTNDTITASGVGAAAAGSTAVEYGDGAVHKTVITTAAFTQAVAGAALGFGKQIYDFPEGFIKVEYCSTDITIFGAASTETPDLGLGTVVASGAVATLDGTATFEDVMDGFTGTAITTTPGSESNNYVAAEAGIFDGHTAAKDLYLNAAATWAQTEDLTIAAVTTIYWTNIGDY